MSTEQSLPEAGLYRTVFPHPKNPQAIRERMLVYFSPVSDQGPPIVLPPERLQGQQWNFASRGFLVEDADWANTLVPLRPQGYYVLTEELLAGPGQKIPPGLLVLLSYTQNGEALVHAGVTTPESFIAFAREGVVISDIQLDSLEPASFKLARGQMVPPPGAAPAGGQSVN